MPTLTQNDADGTVDIVMEQGATETFTMYFTDAVGAVINLAGYLVRMQARSTVAAATTLFERTRALGSITVVDATGAATPLWTATETAAYTWTAGVYDVEIESAGGIVTRVMQGKITLDPEVTR